MFTLNICNLKQDPRSDNGNIDDLLFQSNFATSEHTRPHPTKLKGSTRRFHECLCATDQDSHTALPEDSDDLLFRTFGTDRGR